MNENQLAISPVKIAGTTYDTLSINDISFTIRGNKSRVRIQLDGVMSINSDTDTLSFFYAITASAGNGEMKKQIKLTGDKLPATISYEALTSIALQDANDGDVKFTLLKVVTE